MKDKLPHDALKMCKNEKYIQHYRLTVRYSILSILSNPLHQRAQYCNNTLQHITQWAHNVKITSYQRRPFADDTSLYIIVEHPQSAVCSLNIDLAKCKQRNGQPLVWLILIQKHLF